MSLNSTYGELFTNNNNHHNLSQNYQRTVYKYKKLMLMTHTGMKPYPCSDCDKRFSLFNLRTKGMKSKYNKCSELIISEKNIMQFNIYTLSMIYIVIGKFNL